MQQYIENESWLAPFLEFITELGEKQLTYFRRKNLSTSVKTNQSDLVTEADRFSESQITQYLNEVFPEDEVLGEESTNWKGDLKDSLAYPSKNGRVWVIDPIDGTNNFVHGLPVFCISIALVEGGIIQAGIIYAPYLRETFVALKGKGAFLNGLPIQIAQKKSLEDSVVATGFPYDKMTARENNLQEFSCLMPQVRGIRRMGAAAYDLACVAAGFLDGYWEMNLSFWDVAAGMLLVEEAGGVVLPLKRERRISLIAGNKALVEEIRTAIE